MANYQSHVSFSLFAAAGYAFIGLSILGMYPEIVVLASVVIVIAGMLPDIDDGGSTPAREMGGLLAAVSPIVFLEFFPELKAGGVARIALIVVACYLLTRIVIMRGIQKLTVHRGMLHSVPAALITFEVTYLLFWDLYWKERIFLASAALVGYLSHLLLDAYTNLDLVGKAMGNANRKPAALKLVGPTWGSTIVAYSFVALLGWFVVKDLFPQLELYAGLH